MQIFLTAKTHNGQNFARPRVVAVNDENIFLTPGIGGLTKVEEYNERGVLVNTYIVYETPAQIQAQSLVAIGQATNIYAKNYVLTGTDAVGDTAAEGLDLTRYLTEVDSSTATTADGVQIDAATASKVRVVINSAAAALEMWPQTGENFEGSAANAAIAQAALSRKHYVCLEAGEWLVADDYTG